MNRLVEVVGGLMMSIIVGFLLAFVLVNLFLGCETWDESQWTVTNSCLTPSAIWEGVTIWLKET